MTKEEKEKQLLDLELRKVKALEKIGNHDQTECQHQ